MTPERKDLFLAALRESGGNFSAAAAAVSPRSLAKARSKPGYSSFKLAMANDPEFASQVQETLETVKADVFAEIHRRAMHGVAEPVYQKGERVQDVDSDGNPIPATITRYDNRLLLRLAAKLDPEWSETRNITHSVNHDGHQTAMQISPSDLKALSADQKVHLKGILATIRASRGETPALEHQPAEVIDADYEEVPTTAEEAEPMTAEEAFPW